MVILKISFFRPPKGKLSNPVALIKKNCLHHKLPNL